VDDRPHAGATEHTKSGLAHVTIPDMKRAIVAFPRIEDTAEWRQILSVRARFDPLAGRIAPHLTLVFPFEDALPDVALERHLRRVAAGVQVFPVVLREITVHEGEYLFLNVKQGNDALIHLHDVLYSGALAAHRLRTHTFVPHVTVGRLPPKALPAALDATADLTAAIPAQVHAISLYRIDLEGERPTLLELPLRPTR
jgi:2'-5' RNA ligase